MKNIIALLLLFPGAQALFSQQIFQLTIENGYTETNQALAGDTIHIWAKEWGVNRTFNFWSGDTAFLEKPGEWHTRVIMPAQDVTVRANTKVLPTGSNNPFSFEMIQGKNIPKPVFSYFPAGGPPKLVVWLWHGTGGGARNWIWKDFEMRQYCNYLIGNGVAIIVTESDESTLHTDLDGDGNLRYNYAADTVDNYDVANVRAIRATFIQRGYMTWATPQAAAGFSAGGAFAVTIATFLNWQAAVSHNSAGSGYVQAARVPVRFSMTQRDEHPDVGALGNQQAYDNYLYLLDKNQCTQFFLLRPSPTFSSRFKRIPSLTSTQAFALNNELVANGCFGLGSYLLKSPNQIEDMVINNPQNWPNLLSHSDTIREWVKDELAVMWTSHHFHHERMAADLQFMLNPCGVSVSAEDLPVENSVVVYPNPARGWLYFPENTGCVRVFNLNGKMVLEKTDLTENELDISCLPDGFYFLETLQEDGFRQTGRFLKI